MKLELYSDFVIVLTYHPEKRVWLVEVVTKTFKNKLYFLSLQEEGAVVRQKTGTYIKYLGGNICLLTPRPQQSRVYVFPT